MGPPRRDSLGMAAQKNQLNQNLVQLSAVVRRKGLEPPTYWFVASHSIQLSYRRIPLYRA